MMDLCVLDVLALEHTEQSSLVLWVGHLVALVARERSAYGESGDCGGSTFQILPSSLHIGRYFSFQQRPHFYPIFFGKRPFWFCTITESPWRSGGSGRECSFRVSMVFMYLIFSASSFAAHASLH